MRALIPSALLLALIPVLSGCSSLGQDPASSEDPPPKQNPVDEKLTLEFQKCTDYGASIPYGSGSDSASDGCQILTPVEINHPTYGQVGFVLGVQIVDDEHEITYWLLDSEDRVIARRSSKGDAGHALEAPTLDGSGNIIYTYNPGRSDGCVALRPSGSWFEGFGTDPMQAPDYEIDYNTRFYGCQWTDEDGDGVKEILFMPTGGATENPQPISFKWDGSDYVDDGYRPFPDGSWLPGYEPNS